MWPPARATLAWCSRPRPPPKPAHPGPRAPLILGAAPHPLTRRRATADELSGCDFYMCDAAGNYHQALRQHFEAAQLPAPRMQAMGTIEGVKRGILAGGTALGLLPEHAVEAELREGVLAEVRVTPPLPSVVLRAVLHQARFLRRWSRSSSRACAARPRTACCSRLVRARSRRTECGMTREADRLNTVSLEHGGAPMASVIHCDLEILGGTRVFLGTRVPLKTLIDYLEAGRPLADFLTTSPPSPASRPRLFSCTCAFSSMNAWEA